MQAIMQAEHIVTEYETEVFYYSCVGRHWERCKNIQCVFIQHQIAILLQVCPQMIQVYPKGCDQRRNN